MSLEQMFPNPSFPAPRWPSPLWPYPMWPLDMAKPNAQTNFSRPFSRMSTMETIIPETPSPENAKLGTLNKGIHWSSPHFLIKGECWQDRAKRINMDIPWRKPAHATQDWNDLALRKKVILPCTSCRTEPVEGAKNSIPALCRSCIFIERKCISCNKFLNAREYLHCKLCLYQHCGPTPVLRCKWCGNHKPELKTSVLCRVDGVVYPCCKCRVKDRFHQEKWEARMLKKEKKQKRGKKGTCKV